MPTKECSKCKEIKYLDQFVKDKRRFDGRGSWCIGCSRIVNKANSDLPPDFPPPAIKKCTECKNEKSSVEFNKNKGNRDGLRCSCKDCDRENNYRRNYGISVADYNLISSEQENKCAICKKHQTENSLNWKTKKPQIFCIDHCHKTSKVRGLLCHSCNRAIGLLRDSIEVLESAISYLKKFEK